MGWRISEVISVGAEIFRFTVMPIVVLGPIHFPAQWILGRFSGGDSNGMN